MGAGKGYQDGSPKSACLPASLWVCEEVEHGAEHPPPSTAPSPTARIPGSETSFAAWSRAPGLSPAPAEAVGCEAAAGLAGVQGTSGFT